MHFFLKTVVSHLIDYLSSTSVALQMDYYYYYFLPLLVQKLQK